MNVRSDQIDHNMVAQMAIQKSLAAAAAAEKKIDAEIHAMNNLESGDLERIRHRRIKELKEEQKKVQRWKALGHGRYEEVNDQKEWFQVCKDSEQVVTHFYRNQTAYCALVDSHLEKIAPRHIETRFVKINAEKCPFLVERLMIVVMPTIIMSKDGETIDRLEGFTELGNTDRFTTETLETRLAARGAIKEREKKKVNPNARTTYNANNRNGASIYQSRRVI